MAEYILMNKNTPVLNFEYSSEYHSVTKINETCDLRYAPPSILDKNNNADTFYLDCWWKHRAIPASRNHLQTLLDDLKIDSTLELAEKSFGLSLSDRYWINDVKNPQEWSKINFFDNEFSDDLGLLTLGESSSYTSNLMSPNSTLGGNLNKKWKCINGERVLIKTGSHSGRQEIYNEIIATKLFERLLNQDEYTPYFFVQENDKLFSACKNMLHEDEELVTAWDIIGNKKRPNQQNGYQFLVSEYEKLGLANVEESLGKMLACDFLLANCDRHYRNFGVIRNVETLEYTRIAPIFDTGYSLWCWAEPLRLNTTYTAKPFDEYSTHEPEWHLRFVKDLGWFDETKIDGFTDEVIDVLDKSEFLSSQRKEIIASKVTQNIQTLSHKKRYLEQTATQKIAEPKPKRLSPTELAEMATKEAKKFNEGLSGNRSNPSRGAR